jgi:hypothetical protein
VARAVGKLPRGKQLAVAAMFALVVLTWLAACALLASILAG